MLNRIPNDPPLPRVKTYVITVAEQIDNVRDFLTQARQQRRAINGVPAVPVTFAELLSRETSRVEVVVTFLALLELIKQREIIFEQENTFGEITIVLVEDGEQDKGGSRDVEA